MAARKPTAAAAQDDWRFTGFPEITARFGISADALTVLAADETFPVFSKKICPALMKEWLRANALKMRGMKVL